MRNGLKEEVFFGSLEVHKIKRIYRAVFENLYLFQKPLMIDEERYVEFGSLAGGRRGSFICGGAYPYV